jgi:hypothetical protein
VHVCNVCAEPSKIFCLLSLLSLLMSLSQRKKKEKSITLDEIWMIDEVTRRFELNKKRRLSVSCSSKAITASLDNDVGQQCKCMAAKSVRSETPSPEIIDNHHPILQPPTPVLTCAIPSDDQTSSLVPPPLPLVSSELIPVESKWWNTYCILPKFRERLQWSWKNKSKSFGGKFALPFPVYEFFFADIGRFKYTERKVTQSIETEEDLKAIDVRLGQDDSWRRMSFVYIDGIGEQLDGENSVVLKTKKIIPELSETELIDCFCYLTFYFIHKESTFSFKGTIEGRNSKGYFHY